MNSGKKMRYLFSCGEIVTYLVETDDPEKVFALALRDNPGKQLGLLYIIEKENATRFDWVGHTETKLRELGIWEHYHFTDDILDAEILYE